MARRATVGRPKADESTVTHKCEQILETATSVFARLGYRNTDVQMIADELGIGKASIYRQFPSKQELFLAAVDRGMQALQTQVRSDGEKVSDGIEKLRVVIHSYLRFFDDNQELIELFMQERAEFKEREKPTYFVYRDRSKDEWSSQLASLIAQGRLRPMPIEAIQDALTSLLYGSIFTHYFQRGTHKLADMAPHLADVFLNGVITDAERAG